MGLFHVYVKSAPSKRIKRISPQLYMWANSNPYEIPEAGTLYNPHKHGMSQFADKMRRIWQKVWATEGYTNADVLEAVPGIWKSMADGWARRYIRGTIEWVTSVLIDTIAMHNLAGMPQGVGPAHHQRPQGTTEGNTQNTSALGGLDSSQDPGGRSSCLGHAGGELYPGESWSPHAIATKFKPLPQN
ncbi:hypothetical protein FIBSPDRAFT_938766 [Athelia psychrophila]|uniref:Uncharacterized protein n=1 Tax=Athelia psychrophila TaxID=1759441 RepID=A0A165XTL6_9AGAM|nr:hypothetical protein FIBSPDRAFT_938766 [Fibularhizoctonia sp. CBS 109695]